jgi:hypothetical protein
MTVFPAGSQFIQFIEKSSLLNIPFPGIRTSLLPGGSAAVSMFPKPDKRKKIKVLHLSVSLLPNKQICGKKYNQIGRARPEFTPAESLEFEDEEAGSTLLCTVQFSKTKGNHDVDPDHEIFIGSKRACKVRR